MFCIRAASQKRRRRTRQTYGRVLKILSLINQVHQSRAEGRGERLAPGQMSGGGRGGNICTSLFPLNMKGHPNIVARATFNGGGGGGERGATSASMLFSPNSSEQADVVLRQMRQK